MEKAGEYFSPLLTWQLEPRLGIPLEELSPLNAIEHLNTPVMIIAGTDDRHTRQEESQLLFEQARSPKELWLIKGAKHQNFHLYSKVEYEKRILRFFQMYL